MDFNSKAKTFDEAPARIQLAEAVARAILDCIPDPSGMDALDYGCGTGLVTLSLRPHVKSIVGTDSSTGMLEVLEGKIREGGFENISTLLFDIEKDSLPDLRPGLIVSSMVMHHIRKPEALISGLYQMLSPEGFLCIADLDTEEGDFHPDSTDIHHYGFDRSEVESIFSAAGFIDVKSSTAHIISRPGESGVLKDFPVFLTCGRRAQAAHLPSPGKTSKITIDIPDQHC